MTSSDSLGLFQSSCSTYLAQNPAIEIQAKRDYAAKAVGSMDVELDQLKSSADHLREKIDEASSEVNQKLGEGYFESHAVGLRALSRGCLEDLQRQRSGVDGFSSALCKERDRLIEAHAEVKGLTFKDESSFESQGRLYQLERLNQDEKRALNQAKAELIEDFQNQFKTPYHEKLTNQELKLLIKVIEEYEALEGEVSQLSIVQMNRLLALLETSLTHAKKAQSIETYIRYKAFSSYVKFNFDNASSQKARASQSHLKNLVEIAKALGLSDLLEHFEVEVNGKYWGKEIKAENLYKMIAFIEMLLLSNPENAFGVSPESEIRLKEAVDQLIASLHEEGIVYESISHRAGFIGIIAKDRHAKGGYGILQKRKNLRIYGTSILKSQKMIDQVSFQVDQKSLRKKRAKVNELIQTLTRSLVEENGSVLHEIHQEHDLLKDLKSHFLREAGEIRNKLFPSRPASSLSKEEAARRIRALEHVDPRVQEALAQLIEQTDFENDLVDSHALTQLIEKPESMGCWDSRLNYLVLPSHLKRIENIVDVTAHLVTYQQSQERKGAKLLELTKVDLASSIQKSSQAQRSYNQELLKAHKRLDDELKNYPDITCSTSPSLEEKLKTLRSLILEKDKAIAAAQAQKEALSQEIERLARGNEKLLQRECVDYFSNGMKTYLAKEREALVDHIEKLEESLKRRSTFVYEISNLKTPARKADKEKLNTFYYRALAQESRCKEALTRARLKLNEFDRDVENLAVQMKEVYQAYFEVREALKNWTKRVSDGQVSSKINMNEFTSSIQSLIASLKEKAPALARELEKKLQQAKTEIVAQANFALERNTQKGFAEMARIKKLAENQRSTHERILSANQKRNESKRAVEEDRCRVLNSSLMAEIPLEAQVREQLKKQKALEEKIRQSEQRIQVLKTQIEQIERENGSGEKQITAVEVAFLSSRKKLLSYLEEQLRSEEFFNLVAELQKTENRIRYLRGKQEIEVSQFTRREMEVFQPRLSKINRDYIRSVEKINVEAQRALSEGAPLGVVVTERAREVEQLQAFIQGIESLGNDQELEALEPSRFGLSRSREDDRRSFSTSSSEVSIEESLDSDSFNPTLDAIIEEVKKNLSGEGETLSEADEQALTLIREQLERNEEEALDVDLSALNETQRAKLITEKILKVRAQQIEETSSLHTFDRAYQEACKAIKESRNELIDLEKAIDEVQQKISPEDEQRFLAAKNDIVEKKQQIEILKEAQQAFRGVSLDRLSVYEGQVNPLKEALADQEEKLNKVTEILTHWDEYTAPQVANLNVFNQLEAKVSRDEEIDFEALKNQLRAASQGDVRIRGTKEEYVAVQSQLQKSVDELKEHLATFEPYREQMERDRVIVNFQFGRAKEILKDALDNDQSDESLQRILEAQIEERIRLIKEQAGRYQTEFNEINQLFFEKQELSDQLKNKSDQIAQLSQDKEYYLNQLLGAILEDAKVYEQSFGYLGLPLSLSQAIQNFVVLGSLSTEEILSRISAREESRQQESLGESRRMPVRRRVRFEDEENLSHGYSTSSEASEKDFEDEDIPEADPEAVGRTWGAVLGQRRGRALDQDDDVSSEGEPTTRIATTAG